MSDADQTIVALDIDKTVVDEQPNNQKFRRIKLLTAEGGMADVYEAEQTSLGRIVAEKQLKKKFHLNQDVVRRFKVEALQLGKLNHPNIIQIIDFDLDNLSFYLEFIKGKTIDEVVKDEGMFSIGNSIWIIMEVLSGMDHAHSVGLVHRDMKPSNIFLTKDGKIKISDFGIAKIVEGDGEQRGKGASDEENEKTQVGTFLGTPSYTSPEQVEFGTMDAHDSGITVDHRADIYSIGMTLYYLLTGKVAFRGRSPMEVAFKHMSEPPAPPSTLNNEIDADLDAIVLKSLEKKANDRYQTAGEFREVLESYLATHTKEVTLTGRLSTTTTTSFNKKPLDTDVNAQTAHLVNNTTTANTNQSDQKSGGNKGLMYGLVGLVAVGGGVGVMMSGKNSTPPVDPAVHTPPAVVAPPPAPVVPTPPVEAPKPAEPVKKEEPKPKPKPKADADADDKPKKTKKHEDHIDKELHKESKKLDREFKKMDKEFNF